MTKTLEEGLREGLSLIEKADAYTKKKDKALTVLTVGAGLAVSAFIAYVLLFGAPYMQEKINSGINDFVKYFHYKP